MSVVNDLSLQDWKSERGIEKWLEVLSITDAPTKRHGIREALKFFHATMPSLPCRTASSFLQAMDLSRPVRRVRLTSRDHVIAFRNRHESEFKLFYTRAGASVHSSGINPAGRIAVRYRVDHPVAALESYTTGTIDVWSVPANCQHLLPSIRGNNFGVMAYGGGTQLIIPNAARHLILTHVDGQAV